MSLFVDTSALYSLLVSTEVGHASVCQEFETALKQSRPLITTSYVLVETIALLQNRIGISPVRDFDKCFIPILEIEWVTDTLHKRGMERLFREDRRNVSLVDCISFETMRSKGISEALTLDRHFVDAGFRILPKSA